MGRLEGKRAVVVGAGQTPGATLGNGRATALVFAREGARLLLVDRHEGSVAETRQLVLEQSPGAEVHVHLADVAEPDAAAGIVAAAQQRLGGLDVLHHNVGIGTGDGPPTHLDDEAWHRILDVNLTAAWRMCGRAVPAMQEAGGGSITMVSSLAAIAAATRLTAYKVSKAGLNALAQTLAIAHAADGIRVNAILPGLIDTPMAVDAPARALGWDRERLAAGRARQVPLGHQGTAWDVAHAALFLNSDEAAFITGVLLPVDGGQAASVG